MSSAAPPVPSRPEGAAATDPGRIDVVESLYRGAAGSRPGPSALRPFRPALQPPEGSQDYSWLYRPAAAPSLPAPATEPLAAPDRTAGQVALPADPVRPSSLPEAAAVRRWPALVLLAAALVCATLLVLLLAAG